jgi:hypothetical protein
MWHSLFCLNEYGYSGAGRQLVDAERVDDLFAYSVFQSDVSNEVF